MKSSLNNPTVTGLATTVSELLDTAFIAASYQAIYPL